MDTTNQLVLVVLTLLTLAAAIGMAIYVLRKYRGIDSTKSPKLKNGELPDDEHRGREGIVHQLARYAGLHDYKVLEPVALSGVHGTTDVDAILVGWFGVLGVKCLGYAGDIYGSADEAEWVQSMAGKRRTFMNPMTRAKQSTRVIRDVLFEANMKNIPVETVVVFTDKNAQLALPRSTGHYTTATFSAYLKSYHFEEDKNVQVEPVVELLRSHAL